jgi:hypothetical protein
LLSQQIGVSQLDFVQRLSRLGVGFRPPPFPADRSRSSLVLVFPREGGLGNDFPFTVSALQRQCSGRSHFSSCILCLLQSLSGSAGAKELCRRFFRSCARSSIFAVDFSCAVIRILVGVAGIVLSRRIKRLEFFSLSFALMVVSLSHS